jgi:hypothetical protein
MLRSDLYDLAEKIIAARSIPLSRKRIESAKRGSRTLVARLEEPISVKINYDTLVVEGGVLHIYPDVYGRRMNVPERLLAELKSSKVATSNLREETIEKMLSKVTRRKQLVVETSSIERGQALEDSELLPVIPTKRAARNRR